MEKPKEPYEAELKKLERKEIRKLKRLLLDYGTEQEKIKAVEPVIENAAWMKVKLDEARRDIRAEGVAVEYDNGGGQTGIRENPLFIGYEKLFRSYSEAMSRILGVIPKGAVVQQAPQKAKNVLQLVRTERQEGTA